LGNLKLENNKFAVTNKKEIKSNEFKQRDNWQVELLLSGNNELIQKFYQATTKKIKIKEVAEIFRGKSVMKKDIQPGEYKILNISDIEEGEINFENMSTIAEDARKIRRYELLSGDVVISCRGTLNKVAVFKDDKHKIIASANLIIIRPKKKIISDYLKIFLESPLGSNLINSIQRGSIIMNINPADIGELEIPLPDFEEQREIADHYNKEKDIFNETVKKAHTRWNEQKLFIYNRLWK
jgi:restriction endonuclease S subunit